MVEIEKSWRGLFAQLSCIRSWIQVVEKLKLGFCVKLFRTKNFGNRNLIWKVIGGIKFEIIAF